MAVGNGCKKTIYHPTVLIMEGFMIYFHYKVKFFTRIMMNHVMSDHTIRFYIGLKLPNVLLTPYKTPIFIFMRAWLSVLFLHAKRDEVQY